MTFPYTFTITGSVFTEGTQDGTPSNAEASDLLDGLTAALKQVMAAGEALGFNFKVDVKHSRGIHEEDTHLSGPAYVALSDTQLDALAEAAGRRKLDYSTSAATVYDLFFLTLMIQPRPGEFTVTPEGHRALDAHGIFLTSICLNCDQVIQLVDGHWMDVQERVCFDMNPHQPTPVDPSVHPQEG